MRLPSSCRTAGPKGVRQPANFLLARSWQPQGVSRIAPTSQEIAPIVPRLARIVLRVARIGVATSRRTGPNGSRTARSIATIASNGAARFSIKSTIIPIRDFWSEYPGWAALRITRPYRWATWGAITGWVGYGWTDSTAYAYGDNVYYQDDSVYYGDQVVATAEEYAQQAEAIAASAPR